MCRETYVKDEFSHVVSTFLLFNVYVSFVKHEINKVNASEGKHFCAPHMYFTATQCYSARNVFSNFVTWKRNVLWIPKKIDDVKKWKL